MDQRNNSVSEQRASPYKVGSKPNKRSASTDAPNSNQTPDSLSASSKGILKKSSVATPASQNSTPNRHSRSDSYGNRIKDGSKKHKISFKSGLCEVLEVESWKQYNRDEGGDDTKNCCNIM